ncbi:polyprenol monophosphomannose synthase [Chloroflexota bacterium]
MSQADGLVTVVLPTYNERENIGPLIQGILTHVQRPVEVIVVDDDSPDGTWQVVQEMAEEDERIRLLHRTDERGLTSALTAGIGEAHGSVIAWMDCDLSMPPEVLPALLATTDEVDLAVGSRYVRGGADVGHSLVGQLFSRTINLAASLLLGWGVKDYTSGFMAVRRPVFDQITLRGDYGEYCIDLLARAQKLGFTVREVPYQCVPRLQGESKTATNPWGYVTRGWNYVVTILRLRFSK